jgi:EmrB/QacA subfamily drug resistance transporter
VTRASKVLALISVGTFLTALDVTIINVGYRTMRGVFKDSSLLPWILSGYNIAFAAGLLTAGRMADSFGRKRAFLLGVSVFGLSSLAGGFANEVWLLVLSRVTQALGAALIVPSAMALMLPEFPVERRSAAVGITASMGGLGAALGPAIGGLLVDHLGWRWIFWAKVPICVGIVIVGVQLLRESRQEQSNRSNAFVMPDLLGALLAVVCVGLLTLSLVQSDEWGWGSPKLVASVITAFGFGIWFVRRAQHHRAPVLDLRLFRLKFVVGSNVAGILYAAGFYSFNFSMVQWLRDVWGYSPSKAGFAALAAPAFSMTVSPIGGRLAQKYGHIRISCLGLILFAASTAFMATTVQVTPNYWTSFFPGLVGVGIAIGLSISVLSSAASAFLPAHQFAMGTALYATGRQVGGALGIAIVTAIAAVFKEPELGFRWSWRYASVVMVGAAIAMVTLFRRPTESELTASSVPR